MDMFCVMQSALAISMPSEEMVWYTIGALMALAAVVMLARHAARAKAAPAPAPQAAVEAPVAAAPAPVKPHVEAGIPQEVVAAIAAAVACMEQQAGAHYTVRSIRRAPGKGRRAWTKAAASAYTQPF